jgi:elongator complex protein 3
MATMTYTEMPVKRRLPKNIKLPPENERYMRACADIASALIQDYEAQADGSKPKKDLNLNQLRGQIAKRHYLKTQPPLTAIIAAVPEHYKKYILPKLIAKPIREWLVLPVLACRRTNGFSRNIVGYCSCGSHVQAAPLSSYCLYGYL